MKKNKSITQLTQLMLFYAQLYEVCMYDSITIN